MNDHTTPHASILTTLVLLDPTNADGEAALESLDADDRHIALVVLLSGRTSAALREFAAAEGISLADAGFTYLDQVAHRAAVGSRLVETVLATGPDATAELVLLANERHVGRIVLPPSSMRSDAAAVDRLTAALPGVAVSVAGLVGTR
jgi:hypothetical protein